MTEENHARNTLNSKSTVKSENRRSAVDIRMIFRAWEKLRIVYNAILLLVVYIVIATVGTSDKYFILKAVTCALLVNVLYCAGPAFEAYVSWLTGKRFDKGDRLLVFFAGTAVASFLAFLYTFSHGRFAD